MNSTDDQSCAAFRRAVRTGWRRLAVALLLVSVGACGRQAAPQLLEGQAFPSFMLDHVLGANASSSASRGKMLILNIWATWCAPCRKEMPSLERLSKTLDPERFAVIGLSVDDDTMLATEFLEQGGITFANIFDRGGTMSRQLGLQAYPQTFLIAQDGTLARRVTGEQDWSSPAMLALLEELYRNKRGASVHN